MDMCDTHRCISVQEPAQTVLGLLFKIANCNGVPAYCDLMQELLQCPGNLRFSAVQEPYMAMSDEKCHPMSLLNIDEDAPYVVGTCLHQVDSVR